jgi:hypothetical protein
MLKSVDAVHIAVYGYLTKACGPTTRMLTAEVHGPEVRGLALCSGRVIRFVFDARNEQFKTMDHLRLL